MLKKLSVIIITVTILLTPACGTLLATPPPTALPSVPDTIVVELTWDQWEDILDATRYIRMNTEITLELPGVQLAPADVKSARNLITRMYDIETILATAATAQTTNSPPDELDAVLQHQTDRMNETLNVIVTLYGATINWMVSQTKN